MSTMKKKRILIAVDGSLQALEAVRYVSKVLPGERIAVVLMHIVTRVPESFWDLEHEPAYHYRLVAVDEWEASQRKMVDEFMGQSRDMLLGAGVREEDLTVTIRDRKEGIARDLIAESQKGFDAVVVGRRGVSELKDMVLGSIANKLIERLSACPVWVVGGARASERILLCVDGSEGAGRAVQSTAGMLAGAPDVQVTLLHVVRSMGIFRQVFGGVPRPEKDGELAQGVEGEMEAASRRIQPAFDEAKDILLQSGLSEDRIAQHILTGAASQAGAIVDFAELEEYGTIVVGRRGLTKVQEFFMGRVSNKVVQLAKDKTVWVVN